MGFEREDEPRVTVTAHAGWLRGLVSELIKSGPAWGGWVMVGYLVFGHGHELMQATRENTAVLGNTLKLVEVLLQKQEWHEVNGHDYRRDNLRLSFISCLNQADDSLKRALCEANIPEGIAAEVRAYRREITLPRKDQ